MSDEHRYTLRYQILRYTPNLIRDEWVNIGVVLEEPPAESRPGHPRRAARLIEEPSEIARVRRLHPLADEELLRAPPAELDAAGYIAKLGDTLSNVLQLSPHRAVLAEDFDAELDRLYRDRVVPPRSRSRGNRTEYACVDSGPAH